jgi:hypothetical protein
MAEYVDPSNLQAMDTPSGSSNPSEHDSRPESSMSIETEVTPAEEAELEKEMMSINEIKCLMLNLEKELNDLKTANLDVHRRVKFK